MNQRKLESSITVNREHCQESCHGKIWYKYVTAYAAVQCRNCFLVGVILGVVTVDGEEGCFTVARTFLYRHAACQAGLELRMLQPRILLGRD